MEYFLIFILQLLGIGFHIGQKIMQLDKTHPDDTLGDVWRVFWRQDRIVVMISGLILLTHLVSHFIIVRYDYPFRKSISYFELWGFGIALVLGYSGQALFYKFLGRAEQFLGRKVEDKLK